MEHNSAETLVQVICLLSALATICWTLMVVPMRIVPQTCIRFALANGCVLVGMYLYTYRTDAASYLHWLFADIIILCGFAALRSGTQMLDKLPSTWRQNTMIILSAATLMLLVPPQAQFAAYLVSILSLAAAGFFCGLTLDCYRAYKASPTSFAIYSLVIPTTVFGMLFLLKGIALLIQPDLARTLAMLNTYESKPVLWLYILFILGMNMLIMANVVNNLMTKISNLAHIDELTGIWNRHSLAEKLRSTHQHWLHSNSVYSILLFDLDHFKNINDTYGHTVGDEVLRQTAQHIRASIHHNDDVFRYGGEEFLLILPDTNQIQALVVAKRCCALFNEMVVITHQGKVHVTASFGVATISKHVDAENLLSMADKAMYQAKSSGRNCVRAAP
ncbi:GGDEF domain-containing protein [Shewanella intestini]|uniref:diguanylate cyclase n=1 Tax=Shewanella intestini TaxID=2017544 RepID=A0ABS5I666_9GAMM|nr:MULTISPECIES: GGDEF domain-containing protein [Shewanella]MBR9729333.1 GGDEF domain-containing protein [Shewanella intestini]MRG37412.1 diguanylate cyclase [Shewanella sp. XMDDZSB0408]